MTAPATADELLPPSGRRVAWLALLGGVALIGTFNVVNVALTQGLTNDFGFSPYHIPFYLVLLAFGGTSIALVVRAKRQGRRWTAAFPAGYGSLGAGLIVLLAWILVDVGWREGVGIASGGIEGMLAPSRILLAVGAFLVVVAPLRAALLSTGAEVTKWPAVLSATILLVFVQLGGFHPAQNPWLELEPVDPSGEIWVMEGDGSHQTRLIEAGDGFAAWKPAWSPSGQEFAYARTRQGSHPPIDLDDADVWIANADGTNARPIAAGERWQWLPHWSPDGEWLVYTDESEGDPWAPSGPIGPAGAAGLSGGGFFPGQPTPPRQSADIWRVRADGTGQPERLTDAPGDDRAAAFSPDGTELAFDSTRDGGNTEVYVSNADGSGARRLTFDREDDWGAAWSPDGTRLAFNSYRTGDSNIYLINVDGTGLKQLTRDPASDDWAPTWSSDGSRIVFGRAPRGGDPGWQIWSMAADDGSDLRNLSQTTRSSDDIPSGGGAWAADGRIVFARFQDPPASADPLVREGLGSAAMLIVALFVSLAAVVVRIDPPFGAFALIMGLSTAVIASVGDWHFVPAAAIGGLVVDILVRYAPPARKMQLAGAGLGAAWVLGAGVTVMVTSWLSWSPTLLLGVAFASAALGWAVAGLFRNPVANREGATPA